MTKEQILKIFQDKIGGDAPEVYTSPGRINLIGEHTDYNGSFVFPGAVDKGMIAAIRLNGTDKIKAYSISGTPADCVKVGIEALLKDVQTHPDSYHYERARRLGCSASGVCVALKRLGITQKKDFKASKSLSDQKD